MPDTPYIRAALQAFINDPPDTDFQIGYLEALLSVAIEFCGISPDDELIGRASTCSNLDTLDREAPTVARKLILIKGDKADA